VVACNRWQGNGGGEVTRGRATMILERRSAGWRIRHVHSSTVAPWPVRCPATHERPEIRGARAVPYRRPHRLEVAAGRRSPEIMSFTRRAVPGEMSLITQ